MTKNNFADADMACANMSYANMRGANMRGANMFGAYMSGVNMSGAEMSGADMTCANMYNISSRGVKVLAVLTLRDDHSFFVCVDGKIRAGCRTLTPEEYREHVTTYPENDRRIKPTLAMIAAAEVILSQMKGE